MKKVIKIICLASLAGCFPIINTIKKQSSTPAYKNQKTPEQLPKRLTRRRKQRFARLLYKLKKYCNTPKTKSLEILDAMKKLESNTQLFLKTLEKSKKIYVRWFLAVQRNFIKEYFDGEPNRDFKYHYLGQALYEHEELSHNVASIILTLIKDPEIVEKLKEGYLKEAKIDYIAQSTIREN